MKVSHIYVSLVVFIEVTIPKSKNEIHQTIAVTRCSVDAKNYRLRDQNHFVFKLGFIFVILNLGEQK